MLLTKFRNRNFNLQNHKKSGNLSLFKNNNLTVNEKNPYVCEPYLRNL